jgi:hypothetical protein
LLGQKVFYAVSTKGRNVILKLSTLCFQRKELFSKRTQQNVVEVPTAQIKLDVKHQWLMKMLMRVIQVKLYGGPKLPI